MSTMTIFRHYQYAGESDFQVQARLPQGFPDPLRYFNLTMENVISTLFGDTVTVRVYIDDITFSSRLPSLELDQEVTNELFEQSLRDYPFFFLSTPCREIVTIEEQNV